MPIAPALSVDLAEVVADAQPEAAAQKGITVERPPNDHELSIALGEDIAIVSGQPQLLRNSVSARAQYCKPA